MIEDPAPRLYPIPKGYARGVMLPGVILALLAGSAPSKAQTPRVAPAAGFTLHDERTAGRFVVQRWVSEAAPEVSPAGFCECITVVYEGARLLLNLGLDAGLTHVSSTAGDVTGDGLTELVVNLNSGGAHCCDATTLYSVESTLRPLLSLSTGNCTGRLLDIDGDGLEEFETCDDVFAYEFCAFAFSPMPTVVFAYDAARGAFTPATPRFARHYDDQRQRMLADARQTITDYADQPEVRRCAALGPALSLMYQGRPDDGVALFRQLYDGPDRTSIEQRAIARAIASPLYRP